MKIAIFGGTGKFGSALGHRVAGAGHDLIIASRDLQKAEAAAQPFGSRAQGMLHSAAAMACEIAIIATPYSSHGALLESIKKELSGKSAIDAVVPLDPTNPTRLVTSSGTSAAEEAAAILTASKVFAAFHTLSHHALKRTEVSYDALFAGSSESKDEIGVFIRSLNLRPVYAGGITVARLLECTTALLIAINKANKVRESGIQIVGLDASSS